MFREYIRNRWVQVSDYGNFPHSLLHVRTPPGNGEHAFVEIVQENMAEHVNLHEWDLSSKSRAVEILSGQQSAVNRGEAAAVTGRGKMNRGRERGLSSVAFRWISAVSVEGVPGRKLKEPVGGHGSSQSFVAASSSERPQKDSRSTYQTREPEYENEASVVQGASYARKVAESLLVR